MWKLNKEDSGTIRELGAHVQTAEQEVYRRRGVLFRAARRLADGCECAIADVGINFKEEEGVVIFDNNTHMVNDKGEVVDRSKPKPKPRVESRKPVEPKRGVSNE